MTRKSYYTLLFIVLLSPTVFATTIYKWVDENGVTHYSQEMPPEKHTEKLYSEDIEPKKVGSVSPKSSKPIEPKKTELEAAATKIKSKDKEQAQMICDSAKHQLNVLETHTRLTRKNEQSGEMERMTEEDRQAQIASQKERIRLFCVK
ncbi:DUF4124 domain-containing protein [Shewanella psychrotolerans]|uniref:DUF4124 domain-containing protein n=1 Tax=Shewanella psychrotolerans TaxID=2864206 RepID=UPI001C65620B|nr:DUF4124 domain-containing protein [Shewanella psychrotolerans]QYK02291.1 DUF4124 domain-containing protein [Shewanella psychrotolerans]